MLDVSLADQWLKTALQSQRECEAKGEPFVIRLFNDDALEEPPIFAIAILTVPVIDASISTRSHIFNWKN